MQYDDVIAAFFEPSAPDAFSPATVEASPARKLRDAMEPIAMHSVWSRLTNERLAEFGHDFMSSYVCSRAALLGEPTPGVAVSAFAVFEPNMLSGVYSAGRTLCGRDELLAARDQATIQSLSDVLDGIDVSSVAQALGQAVMAADTTGRPLFSGLRDQPWPESSIGQLWRACETFREHRGDSHVAACTSAGLDAVEMNIMTELYVGMPLGSYSASRGWSEDDLQAATARLTDRGLVENDAFTSAGHTFRTHLEAQTDQLQQPITDALPGGGANLIADLRDWSQRCIDARAFPPDVFKRAAG